MQAFQSQAMRVWVRALARWAAATLCLLGPIALSAQTAGAQPVGAVAAARPAPELFFKWDDMDEALLSPSGRYLAVTSSKAGSKFGLYVYDLVAGGAAKRVAQYSDVHIVGVRWVNEQRLVFSAAEFRSSFDRAYGLPGLYAVNADGSQLLQLVERVPGAPANDGRASKPALHFLHQLLHVPAPRPASANGVANVLANVTSNEAANDEVLVGELQGDWNGITHITPLWLNVVNRRTRGTDYKAPAGVVQWLFDSAGNALAVTTRQEEKLTLHARAPGEQAWKVIAQGDVQMPPFRLRAVDDTGSLYITQPEGPKGFDTLRRFDLARAKLAHQALLETPGFDFDGRLHFSPQGRLLGVTADVDAATTVWFDKSMQALQAHVDAQLPERVTRLSCAGCPGPNAVLLVQSSTDRDPGQWLVYRPQTAPGQTAWQRVGSRREGLSPAAMAAVELHRIPARDGLDLPVWLTLPSGVQAGTPAPAVVLVHGGPWARGGRWEWQDWAQFLASRGYLVISPDFRGSTGYGQVHLQAGWKQWGQAMQDDVADALLWAQKQGLADGRACIFGGSYGGYSTLMGLVRHPELFRCGVAWAAVTDLQLMLKGAWLVPDDGSFLLRKHLLPDWVGSLDHDADMLARNSPVLRAADIKRPLLLVHGEKDLRVPLAHAQRLRERMQAAGQQPEWLTYADEGHGLAFERNRVHFAQRLESFLALHLGAPAAPAARAAGSGKYPSTVAK